MSLKIIGPGFGRTGTMSTKLALETLGFGPCHHMYEVFGNPPQVGHWQAVAAGEKVDWHKVFAGYTSQIDWPGAHVWRELAEAFPDAKVLLTMRPEENWYRSFSTTIGKVFMVREQMQTPPHITHMMEAMDKMVVQPYFQGKSMDKDILLNAYRQRTEDVKAAIAPERLLIFDVAQGWDPLCSFLDVPVPDTPFPHENERDMFWEALGGEPADP